jgi:hypothetical protein
LPAPSLIFDIEVKIYGGEKIASSTSGAEKIGYQLAED